MSDRVVVSVHVPIYLRSSEVYGGPFDGLKTHMPDMVDWSQSQVDLSPLIPWLGSPDIELEVEIIGGPYHWADMIPVRAV